MDIGGEHGTDPDGDESRSATDGQAIDENDDEPAEFGTDVDAALEYWGGYDKFDEGAELTHRVIDLLQQHLGALTLAWVPPATPRVGFRFTRLRPMALTANWGYLWVTNPAVELMRGDGLNPLAVFRDAGFATEDTWNDGLSVWNSRGLRDRAAANRVSWPARLKCANSSCTGAFVVQPAGACSYCGDLLR